MPDEQRTGTYTHGYSQTVVSAMASRSADRQAAFFLPHLRPGMRLIDVGCGPGTITVGLARAVSPGEVLGVDMEPEMVERARALASDQGIGNVRFEVGRGEELPAEDESFDAAFEYTVLEHVADPLRILREVWRVLRPEGVVGLGDGDWGFMVIEPMVPDMIECLALYERVWRHNGGNPRFGRHQRALLRQAGFRPGETTLGGGNTSVDLADSLAAHFAGPRVAEVAIRQGWADPETMDRYAEGIREWGRHPDALWVGGALHTVAWRA